MFSRWYIGPWNPCSVSCGVDPGRQERTVQCVRSINDDEQVVLNKTDCNEVLEPENMRSCSANNQEPCPMWRVFEWKNVSETKFFISEVQIVVTSLCLVYFITIVDMFASEI